MIRVESEIVVDRPPEEVGRFLADIERMTEWTDMSASRKLTDGPVRQGTQASAEMRMGPVRLGWTWEITEFDPARVLTYRTISNGAMGMDGTFRLAPETPRSTRVAATIQIRTRGLLRLLEPLIRGEVTRNEEAELGRMKEVLEATAEPGRREAAAGSGA